MQYTIAVLVVLAVAAQAQIPLGPYGYGGYNGLYGYNGNMAADYMYSSVDLNQDGQPDRPMIAAAPVMSYAAAAPVMSYSAPAPVMSYAAAPVMSYAAPAPVMTRYTTPIAAAPIAAPIATPIMTRVTPVAPAVTSTQYHSQDELGQASFGYAHPGQAATNFRDAMGNQVGSYAYINPEGKQVQVSYVADSNGFRVLSNDLPVGPVADLAMPIAVEDTAEVVEAKAAHFKAIEDAKNGVVAPLPEVETAELPKPVEDTAEVVEAKAEHAAAHAAAKAAADAAPAERKKRQAILPFGIRAAPIGIRSGVAPYAAGHAVREAELLRVVNTPGHAVSYRVY